MKKDYYQILGVLDDAEDIVIRAAYRALSQRYHPDKLESNAKDANIRMAEINEAYGVLSDSSKRKKYDETRECHKFGSDLDAENIAKASSDFLDSINKDWTIAKNHYPEIQNNFSALEKYSYLLAFAYKLILLDSQQFNENHAIYLRLKNAFLKTYFGDSQVINRFAQELILEGQIDAAKELNDHVRVLGKSLIPEKVIKEIGKKYQIERVIAEKKALKMEIQRQEKYDRQFIFGFLFFLAILFVGSLWFFFGLFKAFIFLLMGSGLVGAYFLLEASKPGRAGIVLCKQCQQKLRVPSGRTLEITCPKCKNSWVAAT